MNPAPRADPRGLAALLAGAACIGFAPLWVRWSETGPIATAFHRLLLALPILALWAARERPAPRLPGRPPAPVGWVFGAGIGFALDLAAGHVSIRLTSVANASLLCNVAPIFVTLGGWIFLRERVGRPFVGGLLLALGGAWLLTGASPGSDPTRLRGDLLGLVTAFFYGTYQLCVARLRREFAPGRVLLQSSLVSTPLLGALAFAFGEVLWPATARGWLVVAGLALTAQVLGQGLITYGFAHLPAGYSSLTLLVQPLVATLASWVLLGETLTARQGLGALVLLAGLELARRDRRSTPVPVRIPHATRHPGGEPGSLRG